MKRKILAFSLIGLFVFSGYLYENRSTKTVTTEIRLERNENNQEKENNTKKEIKKVEKPEKKVTKSKSTDSKENYNSNSKTNNNEKNLTQEVETPTNSKSVEDKSISSQVESSENQNSQPIQETKKQDVQTVNLSELNQLILQEMNMLRNTKLKMNTALSSSATIRSQEISILWSHTRPNGTRGVEMLDSTKYRGENLAKTSLASQLDTTTLAKRIVTNWKNSKSHYEIMMSDVYTNAGISTYTEKNGDIVTYYTVALFSN